MTAIFRGVTLYQREYFYIYWNCYYQIAICMPLTNFTGYFAVSYPVESFLKVNCTRIMKRLRSTFLSKIEGVKCTKERLDF